MPAMKYETLSAPKTVAISVGPADGVLSVLKAAIMPAMKMATLSAPKTVATSVGTAVAPCRR